MRRFFKDTKSLLVCFACWTRDDGRVEEYEPSADEVVRCARCGAGQYSRI